MTRFRFLFPLVLISLFCLGEVSAQTSSLQNSTGGQLYCVWNQVTLRSGPGKTAPYLNGVFFGEVVQKTGEEAYAREEKRTYIKVRTSEGTVGWVHEFLFMEGVGMAVITEPGRIYKRPRTVSTITDQSFLPGELVVLVSENNGWINLIGREKKKLGWIQGPEKITNSLRELEIASLLYEAKKKTNDAQRQEALTTLLQEARATGSPLSQAIEMELRGQSYQLPLVDARSSVPSSPAYSSPSTNRIAQPASPFNDPVSQSPVTSSQQPATSLRSSEPAFQSGYSSPSGRTAYLNSLNAPASTSQQPSQRAINTQPQTRDGLAIESGAATIISSRSGEPDIYYAFHRSLPVGSKVYVDIPGNTGFIELRIVGSLASNSPYTIGLPVACYDALLGNSQSRELSITYQR